MATHTHTHTHTPTHEKTLTAKKKNNNKEENKEKEGFVIFISKISGMYVVFEAIYSNMTKVTEHALLRFSRFVL